MLGTYLENNTLAWIPLCLLVLWLISPTTRAKMAYAFHDLYISGVDAPLSLYAACDCICVQMLRPASVWTGLLRRGRPTVWSWNCRTGARMAFCCQSQKYTNRLVIYYMDYRGSLLKVKCSLMDYSSVR